MIFFIIIFVIAIALCVYYASQHHEPAEGEQSPVESQPRHFDLLDDNGDPIGAPKIKIVIDGGDSDAPVQELRYFCIKDKGYHVSVWPKDQGIQGVDYLEFDIAGITYADNVDDHLGEFAATLEQEPTNEYDPNAIKILAQNGDRIGYVPKDITSNVRTFTQLPCKCYCYIGINNGTYYSCCYISKYEC